MKKTLMIVVLLTWVGMLSAATPADIPEGPKIKVLLAKDIPSVLLEAKGGYAVHRYDTGSLLSFGSIGKRFVVHAIRDGLRWGEEYPDIFAISVVPKSEETFIYVDGIQYKGSVTVFHTRDNRITVVNEVAIEDFLKSTLALEFDRALPKEAEAALIIAARTNAYAKVLANTGNRPWDVTAGEANYFGSGVASRSNGVDKGVEATRHMVVETKRGVENVKVMKEQAKELAEKGCDARKILESACPYSKVSVPKEVHYR